MTEDAGDCDDGEVEWGDHSKGDNGPGLGELGLVANCDARGRSDANVTEYQQPNRDFEASEGAVKC